VRTYARRNAADSSRERSSSASAAPRRARSTDGGFEQEADRRAAETTRGFDPAPWMAAALNQPGARGPHPGASSWALPPPVREHFEPRLGADLRDVRVHADEAATTELGARAFTSGRDVYFHPRELAAPSSPTLLAHELTHVAQQQQHAHAPAIQRDEDPHAPAAPAPARTLEAGDLAQIAWDKIQGKTFPLLKDGKPIANVDATSVLRVVDVNVETAKKEIKSRDPKRPWERVVSYKVRVIGGTGADAEGNVQADMVALRAPEKKSSVTVDLNWLMTTEPNMTIAPPAVTPTWVPPDWSSLEAQQGISKSDRDLAKVFLDPGKPAPAPPVLGSAALGQRYADRQRDDATFDALKKTGIPFAFALGTAVSTDARDNMARKYLSYTERKGPPDEAKAVGEIVARIDEEQHAEALEAAAEAELPFLEEEERKEQVEDFQRNVAAPLNYGQRATMAVADTSSKVGAEAKRYLIAWADYELSTAPVIGEIKAAIEAYTGENVITGQRLSGGEQVFAGITALIGLIPIAGEVLEAGAGAARSVAAMARAAKMTVKETVVTLRLLHALEAEAPLLRSAAEHMRAGTTLAEGESAALRDLGAHLQEMPLGRGSNARPANDVTLPSEPATQEIPQELPQQAQLPLAASDVYKPRPRPTLVEAPTAAGPKQPSNVKVTSAPTGELRLVYSRGRLRTTTVAPNATLSAPKIAVGEIKSVDSAEAANRQLNERIVGDNDNVAMALYDAQGNVFLTVRKSGGFQDLKFFGKIGKVPKARLPTAPFGSSEFGNAIEGEVRTIVEKATGQKFRVKGPNEGGADLVPE
jgi:hypothetical protein